ncbi:scarecrow-like protein 23 [Canna indica]|uniref:Scarecrow-like protein 23 n=1 Tax=Canna indica TaxID=4628 RepID=A0AAQ3QKX7_9LILI|nr:scarecrow-like protein 23 [Canna indica]
MSSAKDTILPLCFRRQRDFSTELRTPGKGTHDAIGSQKKLIGRRERRTTHSSPPRRSISHRDEPRARGDPRLGRSLSARLLPRRPDTVRHGLLQRWIVRQNHHGKLPFLPVPHGKSDSGGGTRRLHHDLPRLPLLPVRSLHREPDDNGGLRGRGESKWKTTLRHRFRHFLRIPMALSYPIPHRQGFRRRFDLPLLDWVLQNIDELKETESKLVNFSKGCNNLVFEFDGGLIGSTTSDLKIEKNATLVVNLQTLKSSSEMLARDIDGDPLAESFRRSLSGKGRERSRICDLLGELYGQLELLRRHVPLLARLRPCGERGEVEH